ncbi:hypothetical protein [Methylobacterium sp.]|uniref:hypothetical protein n=1 Tax=Methylobacterium sp. TaxID=409 RepID=UPI003C7772C6
MPQRKHKPEEIVAKLRQVDVLLSQGRPVAEAIRIFSSAECCFRVARPISFTTFSAAALCVQGFWPISTPWRLR